MADDAPVMEIELAMAMEQATSAVASMRGGDPGPSIRCWTSSDEATLSGAWGTTEKGKAVTGTGQCFGRHYASGAGPVAAGQPAAAPGQDLAYTVGFERGPVSIDGGPVREMAMRVTQIYRRVDGGWKLVHRHADFAPSGRIAAL